MAVTIEQVRAAEVISYQIMKVHKQFEYITQYPQDEQLQLLLTLAHKATGIIVQQQYKITSSSPETPADGYKLQRVEGLFISIIEYLQQIYVLVIQALSDHSVMQQLASVINRCKADSDKMVEILLGRL
jgi:hypothetical protein